MRSGHVRQQNARQLCEILKISRIVESGENPLRSFVEQLKKFSENRRVPRAVPTRLFANFASPAPFRNAFLLHHGKFARARRTRRTHGAFPR
jgi:hypothetical protein